MRMHNLPFVLACAAFASMAHAETVLERVAAGGKLVIAHLESSLPFSYLDANKQPVGYAADLCLKIADAVRQRTGAKRMEVEFLQVTPANRIAMVEEGKADLECGSTTNNAERRQKVAFTVPHFITGARLLVKADRIYGRIEDFKGKKIVSTKGTTPLKVLEEANKSRLMGITILEAPDHAKAVEMVESGEADAFVMDDLLLYSLAANRPKPKELKVVGKFLTTEPLAIMLNKNDTALKKLVDEEMRRLVVIKEIYPVYRKWFMAPIPPKDIDLNMPVSNLLKDTWKYPTDIGPF